MVVDPSSAPLNLTIEWSRLEAAPVGERDQAIVQLAQKITHSKGLTATEEAMIGVIGHLRSGGATAAYRKLAKIALHFWRQGIADDQLRHDADSIVNEVLAYDGAETFTLGYNYCSSAHPFPWFLLAPVKDLTILHYDQSSLSEGMERQLVNLTGLTLQCEEVTEIAPGSALAQRLQSLALRTPLRGLSSMQQLRSLTLSFRGADDYRRLENLQTLPLLQTVTLDLTYIKELPEEIGALGPLVTGLHSSHTITYPAAIATLVNVSMRERLVRHNRLLFSLVGDDRTKQAVEAPLSMKAMYIAQLGHVDEIERMIELYYQEPDRLKTQLIERMPADRQRIEGVFTQLGYLRAWIEQGMARPDGPSPATTSVLKLPYHSDYLGAAAQEQLVADLQAYLQSHTPTVSEVERARSSALYGKKRLNVTYEVPVDLFHRYFQIYLLAYAQAPSRGDAWQNRVLESVAQTLVDTLPPDQRADISDDEAREAFLNGKTWIAEGKQNGETVIFWNEPFINFKSAWLPKGDSYTTAPDKVLRKLELWYRSVT